MNRFLGLLVGGVMFFAANASWAQTADDIKKVENYLNNIKGLEADFVQMASNGASAEGKIHIKKPKQIRMEYKAPMDVLIVGDGEFVVYNDKELDQVTHIDYDDIPATIILSDEIKIDGNTLKVSDFYKDAGVTSLTINHKNKDVSPIKLVFNNEPFELKQWSVVDPQSVEITVSLYELKTDVDLDDGLFKFKDKKKSPLKYKNR